MPELESITVKGFKSLAALEKLPLQAINVIVGPNGSGKSNFIGVFSFLHALREGHLQDYALKAGGAGRLVHFGCQQIEIHMSFQGGVNQYRIVLQPNGPAASDPLYPSQECVYFWDKARYPRPFEEPLPPRALEAGISDPESKNKVAVYVRRHLDRWRVYHFHDTSATSPMKGTGDVNDYRYLRPDGANLAAFLYFLRQRHAASYALIRRSVQRVAPFLEDFQLAPVQVDDPDLKGKQPQGKLDKKIRLEWRHKNTRACFDAAALSDGTLRFIALTTLFLQPEQLRPSVILVDEPELGLHPYAISMLASLIKQCSKATQVIVSTQSPLLLDHFQPEDVLVADLVQAGTVLTRLQSAQLESWLQEYSLGQLWEKNELGGRPAAS